jgi:hypothetical protein
LRTPEDYFGRRLQVSGFFRYQFELTALFDPRLGQQGAEGVLLGTQRLGSENLRLRYCYGKRVVVEGYLTHIPSRGGEKVLLVAEGIGLPKR